MNNYLKISVVKNFALIRKKQEKMEKFALK